MPEANGTGILIDSNVIIDYTAAKIPQHGNNFVEQIFNTRFLLSVAVKIEVLGFDDVPDKLTSMEEFVNMGILLPLDDVVTKQTILLRRKYKKLKLGDAIIAATAIAHNLILISPNIKDFINIDGLQLMDPYTV